MRMPTNGTSATNRADQTIPLEPSPLSSHNPSEAAVSELTRLKALLLQFGIIHNHQAMAIVA